MSAAHLAMHSCDTSCHSCGLLMCRRPKRRRVLLECKLLNMGHNLLIVICILFVYKSMLLYLSAQMHLTVLFGKCASRPPPNA